MVVPAAFRHLRVVLRGVQHLLPHELAVLQHLPPLLLRVIVPVHHQRLLRRVHLVVIQIPAHLHAAAPQLSLQLRIFPLQPPVGHQLRTEEVLRLLYILHPRLPEQIQHVHAADAHVSQPVQLIPVPEHAVHGASGLQLVPPRLGIRLLEPVVLQDHRQYPAQLLRLPAVVRLSGQHRRLRIAVHGVRVLAEDAVHQPPAGRPDILPPAALAGLVHLLPVPQLPELLIVDDAPVQILLSQPIAPQHLCRRPHLRRADLPRCARLLLCCPSRLTLHASTSLSCVLTLPSPRPGVAHLCATPLIFFKKIFSPCSAGRPRSASPPPSAAR